MRNYHENPVQNLQKNYANEIVFCEFWAYSVLIEKFINPRDMDVNWFRIFAHTSVYL